MSKLPVVSVNKAIRAFKKLGYSEIRQRGSHIRFKYPDSSRKPLSIPNHKVLGRGLLRKLIRDANITVDEFKKLAE